MTEYSKEIWEEIKGLRKDFREGLDRGHQRDLKIQDNASRIKNLEDIEEKREKAESTNRKLIIGLCTLVVVMVIETGLVHFVL